MSTTAMIVYKDSETGNAVQKPLHKSSAYDPAEDLDLAVKLLQRVRENERKSYLEDDMAFIRICNTHSKKPKHTKGELAMLEANRLLVKMGSRLRATSPRTISFRICGLNVAVKHFHSSKDMLSFVKGVYACV